MRTLGDPPRPDDPVLFQRSPYEVWLLALATLNGYALILGAHISGVAKAELSELVFYAWGGCLAIGGTVALVGLGWRGTLYVGLVWERSGVILAGAGSLIYGYIVVASAGVEGTYAAATTASFGFACFWRAWQITKRFRWHRGAKIGPPRDRIEGR